MARNHTGKIVAGALVALAAAITAMAGLGILPWATKAEVRELRTDMKGAIDRIDQRVDELHRLFFPVRRE